MITYKLNEKDGYIREVWEKVRLEKLEDAMMEYEDYMKNGQRKLHRHKKQIKLPQDKLEEDDWDM